MLAKRGKIIAQAFHEKFGAPHAEANALAKAKARAKGADAYVSLEPCVDFPGKKTPSCAKALVAAGVKRVFIATTDDFTLVEGKGVQLLREAGIEVNVAIGKTLQQARYANRFFFKRAQTGLPYVLLKLALSLDGKIWSRKTTQISNGQTKQFTQKLRNDLDAIMVGAGTVLADDPNLGCSLAGGRDPLRVIIDSHLKAPLNSRVFRDSNCVVFCGVDNNHANKLSLQAKGIRVFTMPGRLFGNGGKQVLDLAQALAKLGELKVNSVLVEGGASVASFLLHEKLVDECVFYVAPKILGEGVSAFDGVELDLQGATVLPLGDNALFRIVLNRNFTA